MPTTAIRKFSGTGSPEGVQAGPPTARFTQTDAASGYEEWRKATGTGNTGWVNSAPSVVLATSFGCIPTLSASAQTAARDAALAWAASRKAAIMFPSAKRWGVYAYTFNTTMQIPDGVCVMGEPGNFTQAGSGMSVFGWSTSADWNGTVFKLDNGANVDVININKESLGYVGYRVSVQDIIVDGNKANQTTSNLAGIRLPAKSGDVHDNFMFSRVLIHDVKGVGFAGEEYQNEWVARDCMASDCDSHGFELNSVDFQLDRCWSARNGGEGIFIGSRDTVTSSNGRMIAVDAWNNTRGVRLRNVNQIHIVNSQLEGNYQNGLWLEKVGGADSVFLNNVDFVRNSLTSAGTYSEVLWTGSGTGNTKATFVNCRFGDTTQHTKYALESTASFVSKVPVVACTFVENAFSTGVYNTIAPFVFKGCTTGPFGNEFEFDKQKGLTPTLFSDTGTGTGGTVTVSSNSTDASGLLTITTGTSPAANAVVAWIVYGEPYRHIPRVTLTPAGSNAVGTQVFVDDATAQTDAALIRVAGTPLAASTAYKFYYKVTPVDS